MSSDRRDPQRPPNVLVIMSDQHAPMFSGPHGHPLVRTPHLDRLASEGVLFENAYCNSPICVPSRMSFMAGRHVHHIGVWDNGAPLALNAVTWAHLLRAVGYDAVLSGKQHFRPKQLLYGFRAQLAYDLHAENEAEVVDWSDVQPSSGSWPGLDSAGPGTTKYIAADDAVEEAALAYVRDPQRRERPWALNVGFLAPHEPYIVPDAYFNRYPLDQIDLPEIPEGHWERQPAFYRRLRETRGMVELQPEEKVRRARAAYYGLVTYLDEKIGRLLDALDETGQAENTLVVYTSDHGEMLGEHGLWLKSNGYEQSVRVPLLMRWPAGLPSGRRAAEVVSLVDVTATIVAAAGAGHAAAPLDGDSLLGLARGASDGWKDEALSLYLANMISRPLAVLRRGQFKLHYSLDDPPALFDLASDPGELTDLGSDPAHDHDLTSLRERLFELCDPVALERCVRRSQRERMLIRAAVRGRQSVI